MESSLKNFFIVVPFSYWLFAWFILYVLLGKKYIVSPFLGLCIGSIENIVLFALMILYGLDWLELASFIFINIFIKILPIMWLYREKSRNYMQQLTGFFIWISIYTVVIHMVGSGWADQYMRLKRGLESRHLHTPFIQFVRGFFN